MTFKAELIHEGEEQEIVDLLSVIFHDWPHFDLNCSSLEHWIWKYVDNSTKIRKVVIAKENRKMVGCHHSGYVNIKIGDKTFLCLQAMDLGTHPDYRRKGVNRTIGDLNKKINDSGGNPATISYWVTTNPIVINQNEKSGNLRFPHPISELVYIVNIDKHFKIMNSEKMWIKKFGFYLLKSLSTIRNVFINKQIRGTKLLISSIDKIDSRFEVFWYKIMDDYDFIIERSKEYLTWRYLDRRGGDYKIKIAQEDDKILGYVVLRINNYRKDYPEGYIVDLLAIPGRLDVVQSLVVDSLDFFSRNKVNAIRFWIVKGHPYERVFHSNGFVNNQKEIFLFYHVVNYDAELEKLKNVPSSRHFFTYGSTDWI